MCPWCFLTPACPCRRGGGRAGFGPLSGALALESPAGGGTRLRAEIPLGATKPLQAATRPRRASA